MKSMWKIIIEYCNENVLNEITSESLRIYLNKELHKNRNYNPSPNTINTYRNYLIRAGYIKKIILFSSRPAFYKNSIIEGGKYWISKKIPENMTIKQIREIAYSSYDNNIYISRKKINEIKKIFKKEFIEKDEFVI